MHHNNQKLGIMANSINDGLKRGHIGGMVFRVVNGKQVIQGMPSHYRDRKSKKQLKQRSGMKNIVAAYRLMGKCIQECFEDAEGTKRPYHRFLYHNLLRTPVAMTADTTEMGRWVPTDYVVSYGSLHELLPEVRERGVLFVPINSNDWAQGDTLRVIKIFLDKRHDDGTMSTSIDMEDIHYQSGFDHEIDISAPNLIAVACIHKRQIGTKWKCSTQCLILL